ncbi:MAG: hypothetical protein ACYDEF_02920 [Methanosarcina sp.]|jgi:hypothetical protein|nr:hypothetical protein BGV40_12945 [Methanosarcina sp. Ant1]
MLLKERTGRCSFCKRTIIGKPVLTIREMPSENSMEIESIEAEFCSEECQMTEEIGWHIIVLSFYDYEELINHLVYEHGYDPELIEKGFERYKEITDMMDYL